MGPRINRGVSFFFTFFLALYIWNVVYLYQIIKTTYNDKQHLFKPIRKRQRRKTSRIIKQMFQFLGLRFMSCDHDETRTLGCNRRRSKNNIRL